MDGFDSLPDEDVAQSPNGDEPARSGVQPETGVEHLWNATPGCLYAGVETNAPATSIRASKAANSLITAVANSVSTQARPKPALRYSPKRTSTINTRRRYGLDDRIRRCAVVRFLSSRSRC